MGACSYMSTIVSGDIWKDISEMSERAIDMVEDPQDIPYSGDINTISFSRRPYFKDFSSDREMYDFVEERLDNIDKGEGEIINLGAEYYVKAYVDFRESDINAFKRKTNSSKEDLAFIHNKFSKDRKFLLVDETGSYYSSFGSIFEAKSYVNKRMLSEKFSTDYFILAKSAIIFCTGLGDIYEEGIVPSKDYLVIPYNKYLLIGWACE